MEVVLTFLNTNHVIKAEQALLDAGKNVKVMPLPSAIRSGCGLCLRLQPEDAEEARELLRLAGDPPDAMYLRDTSDGVSRYQPYKEAE